VPSAAGHAATPHAGVAVTHACRRDTAVSEADLPASLLERFSGDGAERMCAALRFVSPVTTSAGTAIAA